MNMNPSGGQDWNPVVFSKKPTGAAATTSKNVRAVRGSLRVTLCFDSMQQRWIPDFPTHAGTTSRWTGGHFEEM
jgi:hypothetical protein